ncbi:MAG: hypothetical protein MI923_27645 [Phycisphaerales bacterium]|nr:hypothetical protein [Phycisphaerales bacterium]
MKIQGNNNGRKTKQLRRTPRAGLPGVLANTCTRVRSAPALRQKLVLLESCRGRFFLRISRRSSSNLRISFVGDVRSNLGGQGDTNCARRHEIPAIIRCRAAVNIQTMYTKGKKQ